MTSMHYKATAEMFRRAKLLRKNMTESEKGLWNYLRGRKLSEYKFRRQHPVGKFILDFYCNELKLAIEVDGHIHNDRNIKENDKTRTIHLNNLGITVLRLKNKEIQYQIESVLEKIKNQITKIKGIEKL